MKEIQPLPEPRPQLVPFTILRNFRKVNSKPKALLKSTPIRRRNTAPSHSNSNISTRTEVTERPQRTTKISMYQRPRKSTIDTAPAPECSQDDLMLARLASSTKPVADLMDFEDSQSRELVKGCATLSMSSIAEDTQQPRALRLQEGLEVEELENAIPFQWHQMRKEEDIFLF